MANWCFNNLSVRGSKKEVKRFVNNFKPENLEKVDFYVRRNYIINYQKVRSCKFQYYTKYEPYIEELLEFLKDYPNLRFKLNFDECLTGLQGVMTSRGGEVKSEKIDDYCWRDIYDRWYYWLLRLINPNKYPKVVTIL